MVKWIVIIVVIVIVVLLVLFYLGSRWYKFFNMRCKEPVVQTSEIIDNKHIVTRSGQKLSLLGEIKTKNDEVLVCIHDFYGDKQDFSQLISNNSKVKNLSIISYNQRGYDYDFKFKNVGVYVNDAVDVLQAVARRYKKGSVSVLFEGYACGLAPMVFKQLTNKIALKRVMYVNPITNTKRVRFGFWGKLGIAFGFIFGFHKRINTSVDYQYLCADANFNQALSERNEKRDKKWLIQVLQINRLNRHFLAHPFGYTNTDYYLYQGLSDIFYQSQVVARWMGNCEAVYFEDGKHFNLPIIFEQITDK